VLRAVGGRAPQLVTTDEEPPADLLATFPTEPMTVWPISTRVNSPKNDDPGLLVGQETIEAPGLPNLGKWMLDHSGSPAHWLGEIYQGKKLREPINVVIVDTQATSVDDAKERFVEASARAGYTPIRMYDRPCWIGPNILPWLFVTSKKWLENASSQPVGSWSCGSPAMSARYPLECPIRIV
jgi:hypothetical protein